MSIPIEELKLILQQQQAQFENSQLRLIDTLTQRLSLRSSESTVPSQTFTTADSIANSISEFTFDPDSGLTFDTWFKRWDDIFRTEFSKFDDAWKVRLLLRKLGTMEHERYINFILPKGARDFSFDDTIKQLAEIFGDQSSLFNVRYQCLKLVKNPADDFVKFAGLVNRECEKFKLKTMTDDQFKCLIFVCGLQSSGDTDIRTRLLNKIEQEPDINLRVLTTECQRLLNLKHDTAMVVQGSTPLTSRNVYGIRHKPKTPVSNPKSTSHIKPLPHAGSVESGISLVFVHSEITCVKNAISVVTKKLSVG